MKRLLLFLPLLVICFASLTASAKDRIVAIEIKGGSLCAPLEIRDPAIVRAFSIWIGPGVRVNGRPVHLDPNNTAGMFIDWPKGIADARPADLERFEVTFRLESAPVAKEMHGWYVVAYAFNAYTPGGYVYLLGRNDDGYFRNVSSIGHGVEGNWFHSSAAWEELVRPLIDQASDGRRSEDCRR